MLRFFDDGEIIQNGKRFWQANASMYQTHRHIPFLKNRFVIFLTVKVSSEYSNCIIVFFIQLDVFQRTVVIVHRINITCLAIIVQSLVDMININPEVRSLCTKGFKCACFDAVFRELFRNPVCIKQIPKYRKNTLRLS